MQPSEITVAFIGTGVMGRSMAGHLLSAGYPLRVHNRTRAKAEELVRAGAVWCDSPADAVRGAAVAITIVGYPADVEAVYLGEDGIVAAADPGAVLIDMTTSSPGLAQRIDAAASERGLHALDAPVSGGDVGAKNATLTIMVGGDEATLESVRPLLESMGKTITLQGLPAPASTARWRTRSRSPRPCSGSPSVWRTRWRRVSTVHESSRPWCRKRPDLDPLELWPPHSCRRLRTGILREALRQGPADRTGLGRSRCASSLPGARSRAVSTRPSWPEGKKRTGDSGDLAPLRRR